MTDAPDTRALRLSLALLVPASFLLAICASAETGTARFLTEAREGDPLEIAREHLFGGRDTRTPQPFSDSPNESVEGEEYPVARHYVSRHNGVTHISFRQEIDGLEVSNRRILVNVDRRGRIMNIHDRASRTRARTHRSEIRLGPIEALEWAAEQLGLEIAEAVEILEAPTSGDRARPTLLSSGGIAEEAIPAKLMYFDSTDGGDTTLRRLRLVWNLVIRELGNRHWWSVNVDAVTGEMVSRVDWIRRATATYKVYAWPSKGPQDGPPVEITDPADLEASPFGWHDQNGADGHDTRFTEGNNAEAQVDWSGSDDPTGGKACGCACEEPGFPDCPELEFLHEADLVRDPSSEGQADAAVTNVFYWVNFLHDLYYSYGFDEAAGNFQFRHYDDGNDAPDCRAEGGTDCDWVFADVQDDVTGGKLNNATFATPPDGENPLLELHLWVALTFDARIRVESPLGIARDYPGLAANQGPTLGTSGTTGEVVRALDALEPGGTIYDACSELNPGVDLSGKIAVIDRGLCPFDGKLQRVRDAGAIAAIVVNHLGDDIEFMNGVAEIPAIFIGRTDGKRITSRIDEGVQAELTSFNEVDRIDSAFSNDLIVHEVSHGLTSRLVGGADDVNCMLGGGQTEMLSEGWSDFFALAVTAPANASRAGAYPFAAHTRGQTLAPRGLRRYAFSGDMEIDPLTYIDITVLTGIHDPGAVFASAMWEMYLSLVGKHGYDPDIFAHEGGGGNNLAIQLAVDALKIQPCQSTFLGARDAILMADEVLTEGANAPEIWCAFAKRGMGMNAVGGAPTGTSVIENFDSPFPCPEPDLAALQLAAVTCLLAVRSRRRRHRPTKRE